MNKSKQTTKLTQFQNEIITKQLCSMSGLKQPDQLSKVRRMLVKEFKKLNKVSYLC